MKTKSVFGFERIGKMTKSILRERIRLLESGIESGKWDRDEERRFLAIKTAAYYRWQLAHFAETIRPAKAKATKAKAPKRKSKKKTSQRRAAA